MSSKYNKVPSPPVSKVFEGILGEERKRHFLGGKGGGGEPSPQPYAFFSSNKHTYSHV